MAVTVDELLARTVQMDASDLHIKAESHPLVRVHGDLNPLTDVPPFTPEESRRLAYSILTPAQIQRFEEDLELDLGYEIQRLARFRGNVMQQRNQVGIVFRVIPLRIQSMEELNLPPVCKYFSERPRGLVLVTGPAGSGKSTTQAAMIDYINGKF